MQGGSQQGPLCAPLVIFLIMVYIRVLSVVLQTMPPVVVIPLHHYPDLPVQIFLHHPCLFLLMQVT